MKPFLLSIGLALVATAFVFAEESRTDESKKADAQRNSLTEVAVSSDGETWVTLRDAAWEPGSHRWAENPQKYQGTRVWRLPHGDYEVIARRKGFREIRKVIRIGPGTTRIAVAAICGEPR